MTGLEEPVARFIEGASETSEFLSMLESFLKWVVPKFTEEGRLRLNVAVGCTGGQHRSVYVAEKIGEALRKEGYKVTVIHRDISK